MKANILTKRVAPSDPVTVPEKEETPIKKRKISEEQAVEIREESKPESAGWT